MGAQPGTNMPGGPAVPANAAGTQDLSYPGASDAPDGYVFQPGATYPNGSEWSWNRCNTWSSLVAKASATPGGSVGAVSPTRIYVDGSLTDPLIPTGTYALSTEQQEWVGICAPGGVQDGPTAPSIEMIGAVFNCPHRLVFRDIGVDANTVGGVYPYATGYPVIECIGDDPGSYFQNPAATTYAFIVFGAGVFAAQVTLTGNFSLLHGASGASVIDASACEQTAVHCYDAAVIEAGTIKAPASISELQVVVYSAGVRVDPSYYPYVVVAGTLTDESGTAVGLVPASESPGGVIVYATTGAVYVSVGGVWTEVGGGAAAVQSSLVFRPGGTSETNVFTTEAALATATGALFGAAYDLVFDLSHVGGTYTFTTVGALAIAAGGRWTDLGADYLVTFANGTTLPGPPSAIGGALAVEISQTQNVTTPSEDGVTTVSGQAAVATTTDTAGAFIAVGGSATWTIVLDDDAALGEAPHPTVDNPVITCTSGSATAAVTLYGSSVLNQGALTAGPGGLVPTVCSPSAFVSSHYYSSLVVVGLFTDTAGSGYSAISASAAEQGSLLSNGTLYYSNGSAWIPTTAGPSATTVTVNTTVSVNTPLTRPAGAGPQWVVQPVNAGSGSGNTVTVTAWAAPTHGDVIELPDAAASYPNNTCVLNGNGTNVEDPYTQPSTVAATWSSSASQPGRTLKPGWMAITSGGVTVWRGMRAT